MYLSSNFFFRNFKEFGIIPFVKKIGPIIWMVIKNSARIIALFLRLIINVNYVGGWASAPDGPYAWGLGLGKRVLDPRVGAGPCGSGRVLAVRGGSLRFGAGPNIINMKRGGAGPFLISNGAGRF